jgi:hypothetical protein
MKTTHKVSLAVLAAVTATTLAPNTARAQSAQIGARATVQQALTISAVDSLLLGAAFPGTTRTVLPSDAASGSYSLSGAANAEVSLTFTLPANLTFGANNLPVTFGAASAGYNTSNSRAGLTLFNPSAVATTRLDGTTGSLYVFIGASVSPTTQPAGSYTGAITLATAYTGN